MSLLFTIGHLTDRWLASCRSANPYGSLADAHDTSGNSHDFSSALYSYAHLRMLTSCCFPDSMKFFGFQRSVDMSRTAVRAPVSLLLFCKIKIEAVGGVEREEVRVCKNRNVRAGWFLHKDTLFHSCAFQRIFRRAWRSSRRI